MVLCSCDRESSVGRPCSDYQSTQWEVENLEEHDDDDDSAYLSSPTTMLTVWFQRLNVAGVTFHRRKLNERPKEVPIIAHCRGWRSHLPMYPGVPISGASCIELLNRFVG